MSYSMRGMRGGWVAIATCDGSGCAARLEQAGGTEAEAAVSLTYAAHEAGWNNDTFPRGLYCPACKVSMAGAFAAEHCALLLAGWSTTGTRGVYERGGRRVWRSRVTAGGASE